MARFMGVHMTLLSARAGLLGGYIQRGMPGMGARNPCDDDGAHACMQRVNPVLRSGKKPNAARKWPIQGIGVCVFKGFGGEHGRRQGCRNFDGLFAFFPHSSTPERTRNNVSWTHPTRENPSENRKKPCLPPRFLRVFFSVGSLSGKTRESQCRRDRFSRYQATVSASASGTPGPGYSPKISR